MPNRFPNKMTLIDIFSGVGGMSLGFQQVGFEPLLAVEFDAKIADSYKRNHPNTKVIIDDIAKIDLRKTFSKYQGKVTAVIGGPPCQGFSQKGKRDILDDERNYLFRKFIEVVEIVKPQYVLVENVSNILTTENGKFREEIENKFQTLGYGVKSKVINVSDFGVPQMRRRAFFLGKRGDLKIDLPESNKAKTSVWDAISDLPKIESGEGEDFYRYSKKPLSDYQRILRRNSKGIYNHISTKHSEIALKRLSLIPAEKGKECLPKEHLTKSIYSGTWCRLIKNKQAATITTRFDTPSSGQFTHPVLNRAITVREAARLQSFPDDYIFYGNKSSQMKQVGNAVPPLLASIIANLIKKDLN